MLLSVQNLTKRFPVEKGLFGRTRQQVTALKDVSFGMESGEVLGVVGESGCGKSTLGRCVVGLYPPTEGKIRWGDQDLSEMTREQKRSFQSRFQMVFQNPFSSLNPRQRVAAILGEPLEIQGQEPPKRIQEKVREILERVELSGNDGNKFPHEFSGGQRQRINLARALITQPDLVVLDEPVSSLDVSIQASILNLLRRLNKEMKVGYLFISHDLQVVGYLSHQILVMYLGRVVEQGRTTEVLRNPRHPYTQALLAASSGQGGGLKGEPPSPTQVQAGCPFSSRCPYAEDRCWVEKQELAPMHEKWQVACWKWDKI